MPQRRPTRWRVRERGCASIHRSILPPSTCESKRGSPRSRHTRCKYPPHAGPSVTSSRVYQRGLTRNRRLASPNATKIRVVGGHDRFSRARQSLSFPADPLFKKLNHLRSATVIMRGRGCSRLSLMHASRSASTANARRSSRLLSASVQPPGS